MNLSQLIKREAAEVLLGEPDLFPSIDTAFVGNEFAELIQKDIFNTLLVTNQDSSEVLRVAAESDVVAVLYTNGQRPKAPEIEKARDMGLVLLCTGRSLKQVGQSLRALDEIEVEGRF